MPIRLSVLNLSTTWDPTLLWYARAVAVMKTRPITDPTSWRYQAAIHGYSSQMDPLRVAGEAMPANSDQRKYWNQCQHQSWYFLPWHRAYLSFFEKTVRRTIQSIGGPSDWALPYWNYSVSDNARRLPLAFQQINLPDGSPNALFVSQRSPRANTNQTLGTSADSSTVACLSRNRFINNGPIAEFGGGRSGPSTAAGVSGACERTPHNTMHGAVGGWMGAFETAGLDPIFWLHHANIDRLWTIWLNSAPTRTDPTDANWLNNFSWDFHDENGNPVTIRFNQIVDTTSQLLDYQYEAISAPGVSAAGLVGAAPGGGMSRPDSLPEMVGTTRSRLTLGGDQTDAELALQPPTGPAAGAGLTMSAAEPANVHLVIEHVKAASLPIESYEVFVNVPSGEKPEDHPELMAGLLPMFGVVESSRPSEGHGGEGVNYSFDVTEIVRELNARGAWDPAAMRVSFVPHRTPGDREEGVVPQPVEVGSISLYLEK